MLILTIINKPYFYELDNQKQLTNYISLIDELDV
jgi:hypothetical protein